MWHQLGQDKNIRYFLSSFRKIWIGIILLFLTGIFFLSCLEQNNCEKLVSWVCDKCGNEGIVCEKWNNALEEAEMEKDYECDVENSDLKNFKKNNLRLICNPKLKVFF